MTGLHRPGDSLLHRLPAGVKLLLLAVGVSVLVAVRTPLAVAVAVGACGVVLAAGRIPPRVAAAQLRPLRWVVLLLVPFQVVLSGPRSAVVVVGTMLVSVLAASAVTLTTRVSDLLDALTRVLRPLARAGVDPERVALVLALTVRSVPVIAATFAEVDQARRARGLERSPRALLVPLVIRSLRRAHLLGEALTARGVDD